MLVYAEKNHFSILDLRKQMDDDQSGYVDRSEFKTFIKHCDIELDEF